MKKLAAVEHICVGESPLGRDSAEPWQKTGAVSEGGPAHLDDTFRGALQPRWRTEWSWLLDCCDEETGREEQSLTSNGVYHNVCSHFFTFALITTRALSRKISKLISELKLVTDNLLFIYSEAN